MIEVWHEYTYMHTFQKEKIISAFAYDCSVLVLKINNFCGT